MGGCRAGPRDTGVGTSAERGREDRDAGRSQLRLDLAGAAKAAARVDVDAVGSMVIGGNGDCILCISGPRDKCVWIGA